MLYLGSGGESETILEVWMKMRDSRDSCSSPAEPSLTQVAAWWWGKCQVRATLLYTLLYRVPPPPRCCRTARHLANQQAPPSSGIRAERFRESILICLQSKRFRVSDGFPCKHNTNNLLNSEIVNIPYIRIVWIADPRIRKYFEFSAENANTFKFPLIADHIASYTKSWWEPWGDVANSKSVQKWRFGAGAPNMPSDVGRKLRRLSARFRRTCCWGFVI